MTSNHDHATLFVAPPPPPGAEAADEAPSTADHGDEAMHSLRHPFAVDGGPATAPAHPATGTRADHRSTRQR